MLALHRCASYALIFMVRIPLCRSQPSCDSFLPLDVGVERQTAIAWTQRCSLPPTAGRGTSCEVKLARCPAVPPGCFPGRGASHRTVPQPLRLEISDGRDGRDREPLSLSGAFGLSSSCPLSWSGQEVCCLRQNASRGESISAGVPTKATQVQLWHSSLTVRSRTSKN